MLRSILGVLAGFALWTILWLAGQATIFAAPMKLAAGGQRIDDPLVLSEIIGYSVVCSMVSGLACAFIAKGSLRAAVSLAIILLAVGIAVETSAWSLTPVWYHVVFLALLVPASLVGARWAGRNASVRG